MLVERFAFVALFQQGKTHRLQQHINVERLGDQTDTMRLKVAFNVQHFTDRGGTDDHWDHGSGDAASLRQCALKRQAYVNSHIVIEDAQSLCAHNELTRLPIAQRHIRMMCPTNCDILHERPVWEAECQEKFVSLKQTSQKRGLLGNLVRVAIGVGFIPCTPVM